MAKRLWWFMGLMVWAGLASAASPYRAAREVESSLVVQGSIDVNADGSVAAFQVEHRDRLGADVAGLIDRAVPQWRFQPMALQPGTDRARAAMSVRLVARKADDGGVIVAIRGAQFGRIVREELPRALDLSPPPYPLRLAREGVSGTAYVVLQIARNGQVMDAAVEQVNLRVIAGERRMQAWRTELANAALNTARRWTFAPPQRGPLADDPGWLIRVPFDFRLGRPDASDEYRWDAYVPGPRTRAPWGADEADAGGDAIAAGDVHAADPNFHLLTALDAS